MPVASLRAAAGAVSFLTRLPIGRAVALDGSDVARGAVVFPLVGAGVNAVAAGIAVLLYPSLPSFPAAGIALAAAVAMTGALHLDALADTFDAAGARTREHALEIMRDSRVGAYGATAIGLDLLIKVGAVAALLDRGEALTALVAAGALSRAASPPLALALPYPRVEGGPGSVLTGHVSRLNAVAAVVLGVAVAVLVAGVAGAWMALAAVVTVVCSGIVYSRWLGGATGDGLGAATEVSETVALVVAAGVA
jgi:adenosylcobinamide-GDP ribazoletransferase